MLAVSVQKQHGPVMMDIIQSDLKITCNLTVVFGISYDFTIQMRNG